MERQMGHISTDSRGMVMKSYFPHLIEGEYLRLSNWCKQNNIEETSEQINWEEIIDISSDPDPGRAKAINEARVTTAKRYARQKGPKISRGSNVKKARLILSDARKKANAERFKK